MGVPSASRASDQRQATPGVAGSSAPSPASRRPNAARAASRSRSATATANQSRPTSSSSESPSEAQAVPLAISTRPSASSETTRACAPSKLRRARLRTRRRAKADASWPPTVANSAETSALGSRASLGVELDHADALVADRDREGRGGDQPGAQRLVRQLAHPDRAPKGPDAAREALAGGEGLRMRAPANSATATRAPGAVQNEEQRSTAAVGAPDGAEGPAERVAERGEDAVPERVRLGAGGEVVGDRPLSAEEPVRAADAAAHPGLLELAGQDAGELREVGAPSGRPPGRPRRTAESSPSLRRDGDEGEMRVGEPHELQRLARRHGERPVTAIEDDVPAAALQGAGERLGAVGRHAADGPARRVEHTGELRRVPAGHVDEQRADAAMAAHFAGASAPAPARLSERVRRPDG